MKARIPKYQETLLEINLHNFRVKLAASALLNLLTVMKSQMTTCNKYGKVCPSDVETADGIRRQLNQHLRAITNGMLQAEELFANFISVPEDKDK